jgi:hypothetical protein
LTSAARRSCLGVRFVNVSIFMQLRLFRPDCQPWKVISSHIATYPKVPASPGSLCLKGRFHRDDSRPPESNQRTYVAKTDCWRAKRLAASGRSAPYQSGGSASEVLQVAARISGGSHDGEEWLGAYLQHASRGR